MNKLLMNKKVVNIVNECHNIEFNVSDNEFLEVNFYSDNQEDMMIKINQSNNSYFVLNYSSIVNNSCQVNILGQINGSNNNCIINVHTIAENGNGIFNVSVKALEKTINNIIVEDLKGITEEGGVSLIPVLEIDTNEVDASHYATVGNFDEDALFYLQSKGISLKSARELLKESFIYNLFSEDFLLKLNERKGKNE